MLDEGSIIIADETPQNRREYEDLVIKTFFLSNADVKEVDKLLRSLIEARRLATNEQLNSITLRDTADKVAIAERLITIADKAKAEVLVDVELLQLNKTNSKKFGSMLSSYATTFAVDGSRLGVGAGEEGSSTGWPISLIDNISINDLRLSVPSFIVEYAKSYTEGTTLAQPQLRITEGEKASLVIGDREPIPTTTFNTANTVGSNVVPITSFQYQDVGIKIDVEPRVHHNREITLTLSVEVSQISGFREGSGGQEQPIIGTRTISSVIRLKDGETNLLAGLYRVDSTDSTTKTPILSDVPLLGRLFTSKNKDNKTTDLVLTLTPHIIRQPDIIEEDLAPLWVGTESRISFFGSSPRVHSGRQAVGPFDERELNVGRDSGAQPRTVPRQEGGGRSGQIRGLPRIDSPQLRRPQAPSSSGRDLGGGMPQPSTGPGGTIQDSRGELEPHGSSAPVDLTESLEGPEPSPSAESAAAEAAGDVRLIADPSVMSFPRGDRRQLQLLVTGSTEQLYLPLTLSYDPRRLEVTTVDPAPGVSVVDVQNDAEGGWIDLLLQVEATAEMTRPLATFDLLGLRTGSAPFAFTAGEVRNAQGQELPVSLSGATLYVLERATQRSQGE